MYQITCPRCNGVNRFRVMPFDLKLRCRNCNKKLLLEPVKTHNISQTPVPQRNVQSYN